MEHLVHRKARRLPWLPRPAVAAFAARNILLAAAALVLATTLQANGPVSFNRDIRPIMADTCFRCHGPDKSSRMMDLRLDIREEALKKTMTGVIPIVPGKPEESAIIERIFTDDPVRLMPPEYSHKTLTGEQKELVQRWVAEGAEYQGHWAFERLTRPPVPDIDEGGVPVRHPIDSFVRVRLEEEGLTPSEEADRRTLIRRVTLDLTGLPPTPAEVEAFQRDSSADAYKNVVDRLLVSPRYAEKQAMYWLDAVRYADTTGFHGDNEVPAWPYRDYVLRAFHENKPFDEFTREQLAGDLLPNPTTEQKVASAYNRIHRTSSEGGIQDKEYLAKYGADRVRTTSTVFLGITTGCAECHDHKFDPILTKDFYSMKAFFADIAGKGIVGTSGPEAFGSKLQLPTPEQKKRKEEIESGLAEARAQLEEKLKAHAGELPAWEKQVVAQHASGELAWHYQQPVSAKSTNGAELTIYNDEPVTSNFYDFDFLGTGSASLVTETRRGDGLIIASGPKPETDIYTVKLRPGKGRWTALGLDVVQDESLAGIRLARSADRFVVTEVEAAVSRRGRSGDISFVLATPSILWGEAEEHKAMGAIDGDPTTGWGVAGNEGRSPFLALRFAEPVETDADSVLTLRLRQESKFRSATIGRLRLALSSASHSWPERGLAAEKLKNQPEGFDGGSLITQVQRGVPSKVSEALAVTAEERDEEQKKAIRDYYAWSQLGFEEVVARIASLEAELGRLVTEIPTVVVSEPAEPRVTRILARGNWMDDSGAVVEPAIPESFGTLETGGKRATRLDFANWLVSDENPLTARVYVNRLWKRFFGTGLSRVLDDLGSQGEWPTHPALLDWLASEFRSPEWQAEDAHRWDVKHIIRAIVTSHTYRQSSQSTPELDERDPGNRLLARQSRFRVEAENVRDIALAVSGLLVEEFGGPSVRPHQPEGYLAAMNFPKRRYSASHGDALYRRGLYTHWQRTFLHPGMMTFDAPSREECTVNRPRSNTPLQALLLLNDPVFVEAARALAQQALQGGQEFDARLDRVFAAALNRPPTGQERETLTSLYGAARERFGSEPAAAERLLSVGESPLPDGADQIELAALTTVTRTVLNLHETITRN